MKELKKIVARQDANFKLSPSSSNETSINISNEISSFIAENSGNLTFKLFREDFIKAASALCLMPNLFYKKNHEQSVPYDIFTSLFREVEAQFGAFETSLYSIYIIKREDGRAYFNNLKSPCGFNLRSFLVEQLSILRFQKNYNGELIIRLDTILPEEILDREEIQMPSNFLDDFPRQIIYYGAPGTGKSYKIKRMVREGNYVRTTFHPDSDYASFVGAYKPTMTIQPSRDMAGHIIIDKGREVMEKKIVYEFVAQAFLHAYTEAWKRWNNSQNTILETLPEPYYLIIEEINRGNCAQIFGDLFQLLDRDDNGESSYAIHPDKDIQRYLVEQFEDCEALPAAIRSGEEMKLPSNLYIFATMNTSDQSLFPIDSAFKRRWDWEYVPIKDEKKGYYIKVGDAAYLWNDFLDKINEKILKATNSDDKQMGYWFVHLPEGQKEISTDKFVGKVLFYLWNDVFKDFGDGEDTIFIGEKEDGSKYELRFKNFFGDEREERISDLMRYNKVEPTEIADDADEMIAEKLENSDGSINIDKTSTAYTKWKNKHDTYWAACQEAYASDSILKLGHRTDYPNAYEVPMQDGNGVTMRIWHLTHKGEKCMAMGVWIPETAPVGTVNALVEAIPEWNVKFSQKFAHFVLNTGSHIRACSPQYDFNNPKDVKASIEWVKNLAPNFYNTVEDILKGIE